MLMTFKQNFIPIACFLLVLTAFGCSMESKPAPAAATAIAENTLTPAEQAAGWTLLFDGKNISGWHHYGKTSVGKSWVIDNNTLHLDAQPNKEGHWQTADGGDLLTDAEYKDFEFSVDWKIDTCGNSGIFFNVVEDTVKYKYGWNSGPEMQILDNPCHPDGKIHKHRAGDLYDLIPCTVETVKPALQWNTAKIVSKGGHLEQWLNGTQVVEVQMLSPEWDSLIAGSKFKAYAGFGRSASGRIGLQDHGNKVWFKNIKIRKL